jgi:cyanophycin synthetase
MATAGDRRDEDIIELGRVAARHFDLVVAREDVNPRGRPRGSAASLIEQGVREAMAGGARCSGVETVLDEMEATRHALDLAGEGDLVVVCVDHPNAVWKELQQRRHGGPGATSAVTLASDPDPDPEGMGGEF